MPDLTAVKNALRAQRIELPSWAFGNSGTRFKVFAQPGVPRTVQEKIDDAAQVHRFTGVAPTVAVHIPWDTVDDYAALAAYAATRAWPSAPSTPTCSRTTTTSWAACATRTRGSAARHWITCWSAWTSWTPPARSDLKLWFADGTNYPGQDASEPGRTGWPRRWPVYMQRLSGGSG